MKQLTVVIPEKLYYDLWQLVLDEKTTMKEYMNILLEKVVKNRTLA